MSLKDTFNLASKINGDTPKNDLYIAYRPNVEYLLNMVKYNHIIIEA